MRKLFVLLSLVFIFTGCELVDMVMGWHNPFVGRWMYKDSSKGMDVMTFRKDYVFEVDFEGDGVKDVWGVYSPLFEGRVTIDNEGGEITNDCYQPGVYEYKFYGQNLKFFIIGDECEARKASLKSVWQRIPRK